MRFKNLFKKKTTCAVFLYDNKKFLACFPSFGEYYDLPKGIKEKNETDEEAAVRELYEETGTELNVDELKRIGKFKYKEKKDLVLFSYKVKKLPNISIYKCVSRFNLYKKYKTTNKDYGIMVPEIESYRYILLRENEVRKYMKPHLVSIILNGMNKLLK